MKKAILLSFALLMGVSAMAQTKPTTPDTSKKIAFTQLEVNQMQSIIQQSVQKIHTTHIDALKRDSIDNLLGSVYNFINQRETETYHPKTPAKKGEKQ